jgi:hypothetical protein
MIHANYTIPSHFKVDRPNEIIIIIHIIHIVPNSLLKKKNSHNLLQNVQQYGVEAKNKKNAFFLMGNIVSFFSFCYDTYLNYRAYNAKI